ncbi:hypothetical protein IMCC26134_04230 [Verrucomicrobia bacterium IMCC26134]|nr:hypothetical protein IMCC26134_04230 [Verrucomicrobia bacterium IMCC26134]
MKKIFWFLVSLAIAASLGSLLWNSWLTTKYFQEQGTMATLRIGNKYNASRWAEPLPIKKIHAYAAVLLPDHEVLIETDQELDKGKDYFIRFLTRDVASAGREFSLRPLVSDIRLKSEADGTPVKLADTDLMDHFVDKAMGPPAKGVYVAPRPVAEAGPDHNKPTVPFYLAGAKDSTFEITWNNCTLGECLIVGGWLLVLQMVFIHAWITPFFNRRAGSERADFVHPSQRRIDPDAPEQRTKPIAFKPAAREAEPNAEAVVSAPIVMPKKTIAMPSGAKPPVAPAHSDEDSRATTASPFVPPEGSAEPLLKLKRKSPPATAATGEPQPQQTPPPQA